MSAFGSRRALIASSMKSTCSTRWYACAGGGWRWVLKTSSPAVRTCSSSNWIAGVRVVGLPAIHRQGTSSSCSIGQRLRMAEPNTQRRIGPEQPVAGRSRRSASRSGWRRARRSRPRCSGARRPPRPPGSTRRRDRGDRARRRPRGGAHATRVRAASRCSAGRHGALRSHRERRRAGPGTGGRGRRPGFDRSGRRRCSQSPSTTAVPTAAYWRMYALRTSSVVFGPVRCGRERREDDGAAGRHLGDRHRVRRVLDALPADGVDPPVQQRAAAVHAGEHLRAAVGDRGVGQRDPAREVVLGLDERVAGVLVPRERGAASRASCRRPGPSRG